MFFNQGPVIHRPDKDVRNHDGFGQDRKMNFEFWQKQQSHSQQQNDESGFHTMVSSSSQKPVGSQSHLGGLYGSSSGMAPSMSSVQVQSRGMSNQSQFGRSLGLHNNQMSGHMGSSGVSGLQSSHLVGSSGLQSSHIGSSGISGHIGSGGGLSGMQSSLHQFGNPQQGGSNQPGRGILSMAPRMVGQMPASSSSHIGGQSAFNSLSKVNRQTSVPASLSSPSRSSPSLMAMQQQQQQQQTQSTQQQQQPQQRLHLSSSASNLTSLSRNQGMPSQGAIGSGLQSLSSAFSSSGNGIDLSDFPALNNRGPVPSHQGSASPSQQQQQQQSQQQQHLTPVSNSLSTSTSSRPSYGVVSKPPEPSPEFQIHNEDFPALPGSTVYKNDSQSENSTQDASKQGVSTPFSTSGVDLRNNTTYEQALKDSRESRFGADMKLIGPQNSKLLRGKIQTMASGLITNIPKGMVTDQFGMIGLLTFIRAAETEPNLVTLALGSDLTTLGLNLNSPESLYHTFGSPFADAPCRPHEIDFTVPPEYRINSYIREKLAAIKLSRYGEDLLFYLYYTNGGDVLQLAAAAELYARDWRYHKDERVWLTRAPGVEPQVKTSAYERGTYYFFDSSTWRKVPKEFHLEYDKLDDKPTLQPHSNQ